MLRCLYCNSYAAFGNDCFKFRGEIMTKQLKLLQFYILWFLKHFFHLFNKVYFKVIKKSENLNLNDSLIVLTTHGLD